MERKKHDLRDIAVNAGSKAAAIFEKTKDAVVRAADQNDDGVLDVKDVAEVMDAIGNAAQSMVAAARERAEDRKIEADRKELQPIFIEDLDSTDFAMSKLIRITEIDKRRAESVVCKDSIGYYTACGELRIINIFQDKVDLFGLTFYPDEDCEIYYVDPSDRDRYIALDDYFSYLKVARVNELQMIAQALGARHFKVTYKEQKTVFSKKLAKGKENIKYTGINESAEAERELAETAAALVEIAAESEFSGHEPVEPRLNYLQRDPAIQTLIALRLNESAPVTHQKYTLKLSNSSGLKEKDAVKIDVALKMMKISGNTTVVNEVQNEARRFFEYEIDF